MLRRINILPTTRQSLAAGLAMIASTAGVGCAPTTTTKIAYPATITTTTTSTTTQMRFLATTLTSIPAKRKTSVRAVKQPAGSPYKRSAYSDGSARVVPQHGPAIEPTHPTAGEGLSTREAAFCAYNNDSYGSNMADGHQMTRHGEKNEWREGWDHHTSKNVNPSHPDHIAGDGKVVAYKRGFGQEPHAMKVTNVVNDAGKHSKTTNRLEDDQADRWRNVWSHEGRAQMKSRSVDEMPAEGDAPVAHRQRCNDAEAARQKRKRAKGQKA